MADVFISYTSSDASLAMRIYNDLKRTGATVWRFEVDSKKGIDFREDFRSELRTSKWFCLLDSPDSRRSSYVREECSLALASYAETGRPKLLLCNLEGHGDWRSEELFPGQNFIQYVDFSGGYAKGISSLCESIGRIYAPLSGIPWYNDLNDELHACDLPVDHLRPIADAYSLFVTTVTQSPDDIKTLEVLLQTVLTACKVFGVTIAAPRLALGVLLGTAGRHEEALPIFDELTRVFATDPRGWACFAGANYYLSSYEDALTAYRVCARLIIESGVEEHRAHFIEVIHNTTRTLVALGRDEEAIREIDRLPETQADLPVIQALLGAIHARAGDPRAAAAYYEAAIVGADDAEWYANLAQCYRVLGADWAARRWLQSGLKLFPSNSVLLVGMAEFHTARGEFDEAKVFLEKALDAHGTSLMLRAELLRAYRTTGCDGRFTFAALISESMRLTATTASERYYLGLIYYLAGKPERAGDEFAAARRDPVVALWPSYSELFDEAD